MPGLSRAAELRAKKANLWEQQKAILDTADQRGDGMTAEERQQWDRIDADIESLTGDIERIEQHEQRAADLAASQGTVAGRQDRRHEDRARPESAEERERQYAEAFGQYLRFGMEGLAPEQRTLLQNRYQRHNDGEVRAQTVTTTAGGYLIPQGFSGQLEESMKAYGGVETACDVFDTETGNTLPWPTVDDTANTGRLLAINTQATTTDVTYGVVNFNAYKFSSDVVLVPEELMQDSAFDLNAHLAGVLGTRLGRVHNTYQTTGTGSSQPQGIETGASSGVTAASATVVTYDELLDLEHSVDPAYRNAAFGVGYMFNDGTFKKLRQMKDGEGRPLWQTDPRTGAPDTLNGYPYTINQDMDAMTTGNTPIIFGALRKFKVRRVKGFTLLRLVERYADYHQIGFLAFTRMDSRLLDAGTDPLKKLTMA